MGSLRVSPRSRGISLIEVVVGIALMGTLAATALVAGTSHMRQLRAAEKKQSAVTLLDDFLTHWSRADFKLNQAVSSANETGVSIRSSINLRRPEKGASADTPVRTDLFIELVPQHQVISLNGLVYSVLARDFAGGSIARARAEIVVANE